MILYQDLLVSNLQPQSQYRCKAQIVTKVDGRGLQETPWSDWLVVETLAHQKTANSKADHLQMIKEINSGIC